MTELEDGKIPETEDELREALGEEEESGEPEPESKEVVITLSTGEVFKGQSEKEVLDKIVRAKEEATYAIRDRERQIKELRGEEKKPTSTDGFDKNTYYSLFAEDPQAAFNYQMAHAIGVKPEEVVPALRYTLTTSQTVAAHLENANFRLLYPDAPEGDEFADKMIARMNEKGRYWTADNLGSTYLELVHEGQVSPSKGRDTGEDKKPSPPPSVGKSKAGPSSDVISKARGMGTDELEHFLREQGML